MDGEIVRYKNMANSGDLIASMAGMKYVYEQLGKKAVIYQRLNVPGEYYPGAIHPLKNDNNSGTQVTMNSKQWEMLKPLLLSQEYVAECHVWEGQEVDVDFDKMREGEVTTMPFGSINRWPFYVHPYLSCDLSKPWIEVVDSPGMRILTEDCILVNYTCRYRNDLITYFFLKEWEDKIIFAGLPEEHDRWCSENKLSVPLLTVNNFLELAQAIKHSKFVLCNASMVYNIAEAQKKKRVLEVCKWASNCIPCGPEGYDFLHQDALKFFVKKFMGDGEKR